MKTYLKAQGTRLKRWNLDDRENGCHCIPDEERENAHMCPCGSAVGTRTYKMGERDLCKVECFKTIRKIYECGIYLV